MNVLYALKMQYNKMNPTQLNSYAKVNIGLNRININNAFSWALILVPVYLYKRGSILNKTYKIGGFKSQWPLMTWVLFFFLSALLMPV